jgi:hypothetical protein
MNSPLSMYMLMFGMYLPKPPQTNKKEAMPAPKISPTDIQDKIKEVGYLYHGRMTICVLTLENGYLVTGESSCVAEANYNRALGEQYAYENAFDKVGQLEGYLLRQKLFEAGAA